jgi:GTP-binding protein
MINPVYFNTTFTKSARTLDQLPQDSHAEVAFAGRSNSGKSSAINVITRNRKLARTSKTPGRTQLINHFEVTPGQYLVDLPGYGYAKVSKSQLAHWRTTLGGYLLSREPLRCLIIVMDIRHPLSDHDWRLIDWAMQAQIDLHCLLTKSDKLSRGAARNTLLNTSARLEQDGIECTLQIFSALKKTGVEDAHELLDHHLATGGNRQS